MKTLHFMTVKVSSRQKGITSNLVGAAAVFLDLPLEGQKPFVSKGQCSGTPGVPKREEIEARYFPILFIRNLTIPSPLQRGFHSVCRGEMKPTFNSFRLLSLVRKSPPASFSATALGGGKESCLNETDRSVGIRI